MTKHEQIKAELKDAMKAKEEVRLRTIRSLLSMFTNELVATKRTPQELLSDDEVLTLIKRAAKQRKESITQFEAAGRTDLSEPEKAELEILEAYLPQLLSEEEILPIVANKKAELGIDDKSKMGMLVGAVMKDLAGKADGALVKRVVEAQF